MSELSTYTLFEITTGDSTSDARVVQVPAEAPRFLFQILENDSRTASDRARAEKARQDIEVFLSDVEGLSTRIDFLDSFYEDDNSIVNFSTLEFVSGSFRGDAHFSFLEIDDTVKYKKEDNFLITSQSNDTTLLIGNSFNDYENKQTTTFKNAEVIVSGSMEVTEVLKLKPLADEPDPIEGGLYYSTDGNFFAGLI